ncbi:hypothetical protein [Helicobacter pylori]|uniref:Putative Hac prophage II protein n=1 Tax=Helicobacter pylori Hp P-4 TaxID=992075 RepID=I9WEX4_HELPX|nr:hypothetical protein [Helicobacter pylori]EJC04542.1 putative Hac prophage II protein [Helicobacter pylori Hp P-4]EJC22886.1 putative Hac prophage II protein [Helicobacter pylori Hp P-4d]EJC25109.1 putative Hac prophage II protein [Helicobacter pylori Hp P-4c]
MRQKNETATSFNQLKEITQIMQAQKRSAKTSENAQISEPTQEISLKPKDSIKAKKGALKPTKRAFSERQNTAFRDQSQARANKSQETKQGNKQANHANAFKTDEALKQGLATHQEKGGNNAKA